MTVQVVCFSQPFNLSLMTISDDHHILSNLKKSNMYPLVYDPTAEMCKQVQKLFLTSNEGKTLNGE